MSLNTTPYDSSQLMYIAEMRAELEAQLEAAGVDPSVFFERLDGEDLVDLKDDPFYQQYLLLAFQELSYLVFGGEDLMSIYGDTDIDWTNFTTMQNTMDDDLFNFLDNLLQDNPEFMAMFVTMNDGVSHGNQVLAALEGDLSALNTSSDNQSLSFSMESTYAFLDKYGIQGLDHIAGMEGGIREVQASILSQITELQDYITQIMGSMEGEELQAHLESTSMQMNTLMIMYQNSESALQTMVEMTREVMKSMYEGLQQIAMSTS